MDELELELELEIKLAKQTKIDREYLSKTHKKYLPDTDFYKDLYSEEPIKEEKCSYKKPRIGNEHQAKIN